MAKAAKKAPAKAKPKAKPKRKPTKNPGKGGSLTQTHYRPAYDAIVRNLVQLRGCTIAEIAEILGKSQQTIYKWQADYQSFREALIIPIDAANKKVEASLYDEATGYYVDEDEIRIVNGKVLRLKKKIWQRPNTTAIIWWQKVKAGYGLADPPDPGPQGMVIDQNGQPETDRQIARRIAFLLNKGDRERETT